MDSLDYQFDAFDDGSSRLVGEKHVENMDQFLDEYASELSKVETALQETMSDVGDMMRDPISISLLAYEQTNIIELINTENKTFNKVLLVFTSLCKESNQLVKTAREKFYTPFLLFGQESSEEPEEGDAQTQIGKMLPLLKELSQFVSRAYAVVKNYTHQLASLYYAKEKLYVKSFKNVHFNTVFYTLSELLTCLITLDEIITQNPSFKHVWDMYKRMTKNIKQEPARYNTAEEQLLQFEKLLLSLEGQLLDGLIFQNCIEQEFDFPGVVEVRANEIFENEFMHNIKEMYTRMTAKTGDLNQIYQRRHFIGLCGLYAFYFTLFKKIADKKFFKAIWELHKIIPLIHLQGNIVWFPNEFLAKRVPFMVKNTIGSADVRRFQQTYATELDRNFPTDVNNLYLQLCTWMVRMESNLSNRADKRSIIQSRITLFTNGLFLGFEIGDLFKQYVYLHSFLRIPIKPSRIRMLCKCVEMLKAIQFTFHRKNAMVAESVASMVQQIQFQLQRIFFPIKEKLEQGGSKYSEQRLDVTSAATLAMQMLNGCATQDRRLILRLSMNVLFQLNSLKEEQIDTIKQLVRKLDVVSSLELALKYACNCSFFYWSRILLPPYFKDTFENPELINRVPYMFAALRDIVPLLSSVAHVDPKEYLQRYDKEVFSMFEDNLLKPLREAIEVDIRIHIHQHLKVSDRDPFKTGVKDLAAIVNLKPFFFVDRVFSVREYITNYLNETYYNLTTVALFDWATYAKMRKLAEDRYRLSLLEVHLPGQTLEQGVDILELMRNVHVFVANYYYDLNNQVFVERVSDGKFLNTVNISHIANSLRTHGAGIMNTTVNFTFQFLRQKFIIFSQFLYDDHIKSRLYKATRYFKENKEACNSKFPYEHAEKFLQEIRTLGVDDKGNTYLDAFRVLITEIGNAMGYIRLVRSGGLYYTYNSIKFVPDLQELVKFEELVKSENLSNVTVEAARNLDFSVESLSKNFAEGTDYFKILVAAFAPEFRNENNLHLKNFHAIIPPLTLNFVSYMLKNKEKLFSNKKGQTPSYCYCDDGFATGVAYILKLLDQNVDFDSLHWFDSVTDKFATQNASLQKLADLEKKGGKRATKEQQTAQLTLNKNKNFLHEFELLKYSLSGARIFFKD